MKYLFVATSLLFLSVTHAKVTCEGEDKSSWIRERRTSQEDDVLFKYGESLFGKLARCDGKITQEFDGQQFGTITFYFGSAGKLSIETQPPESSREILESLAGFSNEAAAIEKLKSHTAKVGLKIDWSKKPEIKKSAGIETHRFWDPDAGLNGQGILTYKNKKLIGIGYSMTL